MTGAVYTESQAFAQPLIWILVVALAALAWWAFIQQIILGHPVGSRPGPDGLVIGLCIFAGVLVPLFLATSVMVTTIDTEGLEVRVLHRLFPRIQFPIGDIIDVRATAYRPLLHWGGWGFRHRASGDVVYSVGGRSAVRILTATGRSVLVGTKHPDVLAMALRGCMGGISPD